MTLDRKFLSFSLAYAVAGMCLGMYMAGSKNHVQHPTHAHILLVGFAVPMFYALIHKLWLNEGASRLAQIQFVLHQCGVLVMSLALFLLMNQTYSEAQLGPFLGLSSGAVLLAMLMMAYMVIRSNAAKA